MSDRDSGGFAIGFILGAIAGVAIGFLYAPKSGQETRALLRQKADEVYEKTSEIIDKAKEAAEAAGKRVRERLT